MILNIGTFKHRLAIVARPQTPNADASIDYAYDVLSEVWGYIEPLKGSTYLYRQQIDSSVTHKIYMRYFPTLTAENWLVYRKGTFKSNINCSNDALITKVSFRIKKVKNLWQQQRFLELDCEEQYES